MTELEDLIKNMQDGRFLVICRHANSVPLDRKPREYEGFFVDGDEKGYESLKEAKAVATLKTRSHESRKQNDEFRSEYRVIDKMGKVLFSRD